MNSIEHLLVLKQNLKPTHPIFMDYLDKIWCNGDKNTYKSLVSTFGFVINSYWGKTIDILSKKDMPTYYPSYKDINRAMYQHIFLFDKYLNSGPNANLLVRYSFSELEDEDKICNFPNKINTMELYSNFNKLCNITDVFRSYITKNHIETVFSLYVPSDESFLNECQRLVDTGDKLTLQINGEPFSPNYHLSSIKSIEVKENLDNQDTLVTIKVLSRNIYIR